MNKSHNASPRDPLALDPSPRTWHGMVAIEPGLAELERRAAACPSPFSPIQYCEFKRELYSLVGTGAHDPRLSSCHCWDVAIDRIVQALYATPPATPGTPRRTARAKGQGG